MSDSKTDNPLYWRDEILQVMFWMTSEGFAKEFSPADVKNLVAADDRTLADSFDSLLRGGYVERVGGNRFTLTQLGNTEGGQRFAEEFEELMKPGHYECSEPDCDCHDPEFAGDACKHFFHSDTSELGS